GLQRQAVDRGEDGGPEHLIRFLQPPFRDQMTGPKRIHAREADHLARLRARKLFLIATVQTHEAGKACSRDGGAFLDYALPEPRPTHLPSVRQMEGLEIRRGKALVSEVRDAKAFRGLLMAGRLVPEGFQQSRDTVVGLGCSQQNGYDQVLLQALFQLGIEPFRRGLLVLEKLLQQIVVKIRQAFHQLSARFFPSLSYLLGNFDKCRWLIRLVAPGPLAHQVEEADDFLSLSDGHLAQKQRTAGGGLKRGQERASPHAHASYLVDDDQGRDSMVVEALEHRRKAVRPLGLDTGHHHGNIRNHQGVQRILPQFHRAWTVDHGPGCTRMVEARQVGFGGHLAATSFRGAVTKAGAVADPSLAWDRTGGKEHGLQKGGLPAGIVSDQSSAAGGGMRISHNFLPVFLFAPSWRN